MAHRRFSQYIYPPCMLRSDGRSMHMRPLGGGESRAGDCKLQCIRHHEMTKSPWTGLPVRAPEQTVKLSKRAATGVTFLVRLTAQVVAPSRLYSSRRPIGGFRQELPGRGLFWKEIRGPKEPCHCHSNLTSSNYETSVVSPFFE